VRRRADKSTKRIAGSGDRRLAAAVWKTLLCVIEVAAPFGEMRRQIGNAGVGTCNNGVSLEQASEAGRR
jgi:hypothetical protein